MNFEQFVHTMEVCTKNKVRDDEEVTVQKVAKNNGVVYVGLSIRKKNEAAAPIIYLEPFYQRYLGGISVEELSSFLLCQAEQALGKLPWNYREILDFEKIKHRIVYRLINAKKNENLLKEVPNLPMFDFAIVFYIHITGEEGESASVLIRNSNLQSWGCPISLLYQYAKENTQRIFPCEFGPMQKYLEEERMFPVKHAPLFLLTNTRFLDGAAVILYPGIPGKIYEYLGGNYYLLPSSIHEFLVIPESESICPENLRKMVREANRTQVEEEEFLSDHIYYFNGDIITKM